MSSIRRRALLGRSAGTHSLVGLLEDAALHKKSEVSIAEGIDEVGGVERMLAELAAAQQAKPQVDAISCSSYWNPLHGTFTYHTHAIVDAFRPDKLDQVAQAFFNAYSLDRQGWYSQFVSGENVPLPSDVPVQPEGVPRDHQIGQGYFDFGMATLRRYHTLISLRRNGPDAVSVVLRSINHPFESQKSKKVFLLAPTGDHFVLEGGQLHWHHICTVTGIALLPGVSDKYLMNCLRRLGLDGKERKTYEEEAQSFIQFASGL